MAAAAAAVGHPARVVARRLALGPAVVGALDFGGTLRARLGDNDGLVRGHILSPMQ